MRGKSTTTAACTTTASTTNVTTNTVFSTTDGNLPRLRSSRVGPAVPRCLTCNSHRRICTEVLRCLLNVLKLCDTDNMTGYPPTGLGLFTHHHSGIRANHRSRRVRHLAADGLWPYGAVDIGYSLWQRATQRHFTFSSGWRGIVSEEAYRRWCGMFNE